MMVDEKNCNDVLGNKGSVVYEPKSEVLTLTWATIDATKQKSAYSAINGGGGDLTIRVVGHCTLKSNVYGINYGVFGMKGGAATSPSWAMRTACSTSNWAAILPTASTLILAT